MENEIEIVKRLTGETEIVFNDSGWDSRVYLVNNGKLVFKFPRNDEAKKDYQKQIIVLNCLKNQQLSVNIPVVEHVGNNNEYYCY